MRIHFVILSLVFHLGLFTAWATSPALADEELDSLETFSLNEIVITGTRTPKLLKDTPIQTRLISQTDLRQADATNLQDLLQAELPGAEFSYAMNQQTNMNLAGFAGQSVLVLIDGDRIAGETMDNIDFSRLPMASIERIEIVKGASSAIYGSSAAGAVINIITKKPGKQTSGPGSSKKVSGNANVRAAGHGEWRAGIEACANVGIVGNIFNANFQKIDSYDVCLDPSDACDFRHVPGQKVWNFQDRLSVRAADNVSVTARAGYYFKERYYNADAPDRYRAFAGGLKGEWDISDKNKLEVSYAFDQYDKSDYLKEQSLDVRDYRNVQNTLHALFSHRLDKSLQLIFGADAAHDYLDTYQFEEGKSKEQTTADVYAQGDWTINKRWEVIGALRYDYFSDSNESQLTAKVNGRWRKGHLTMRGGYAGGFRAPTLKEKYMDFDMAGIFDIHGNPNLLSEHSHNLNLSAEYSWRNYNFTLGGNFTFVNNKITTSGISYGQDGVPYIDYINVDRLNVGSIDANVQATWPGGFSARLGYAFTHEETIGGGTVTQYCPARPHAINVRGAWKHSWIKGLDSEVVVSGRFLSKISYESMYMYEPFEHRTIVNPAYTLWKAQISLMIKERVMLTLAIDNIFNYAPAVYSYNAPITTGSNLMAGLTINL